MTFIYFCRWTMVTICCKVAEIGPMSSFPAMLKIPVSITKWPTRCPVCSLMRNTNAWYKPETNLAGVKPAVFSTSTLVKQVKANCNSQWIPKIKVAFFREFFQISKRNSPNHYPELEYLMLFNVMGGKLKLKFQVQDRDLEWFFLEIWQHIALSEKKSPLRSSLETFITLHKTRTVYLWR